MSIPELLFRDVLLFDVLCALFVHLIYKQYEPDPARFFLQFLLLGVVPSVPTAFLLPHFQGSTVSAIITGYSVFYFTLITSILVYRLSPWHPLAKYPGPIPARISKLWSAYVQAKGKSHVYIKELHEKYGPYVRTGPNELSVVDVTAISSILGGDGMPKGPLWTARTPPSTVPPLIALRTTQEHARRRKRWNRAFNSPAVNGYEPIVQKRTLQFVNELEKRSVKNGVRSVDLALWLNYFATDFMGDMIFGGGFELMRDAGDKEGVWTILENTMWGQSILMHLPGVAPYIRMLPFVEKVVGRFREFGIQRALQRKANGSLWKDLFYHLIDEDHVEEVPPTDAEVFSDGALAIIAGSDTTSTTLSGVFYYLLSNPVYYHRLQKEIDQAFPPGEGDPFDTLKLSDMQLLNAVINEALRLQPPVPTYLQRAPEARSGGKWIGNRFVPEKTAVFVSPYALHRNPAYFSPAPETFWPDRWLQGDIEKIVAYNAASGPARVKSDSEVYTNTAAFIPFSYGPANCAGRALAWVEMRVVIALLMQRFEPQFAPGYDPKQWEEQLEDHFVVTNGPLPVMLTPRM